MADQVASRAAFFLVLALVFQVETLLIAPRDDSAAWLYMGARQTAGEMPGRELWDNKLPLIYLVGRAAMAGGAPQTFLWLLEGALTALGALAVGALVSTRSRGEPGAPAGTSPHGAMPALFAGALFCVLCGAPSFHGGGYMTEVYATPLSAGAALLTWRAARRPSPMGLGAAAGFIWMLAVSFRLPLALAPLAILCVVMPTLGLARGLRCATGHLLGAAFGAAVVFAHPLLAGYARDCWQAAVTWPLNAGGGRIPGPLVPSAGARLADFGQDLLKLGWLHVAAIAGLLIAPASGAALRGRFAAAWYVAAVASAALGWASHAHYLYVAFAPTCLGCGLLVEQLRRVAARRVMIILLVVTATVVAGQNARQIIRHHRSVDDDHAALVEFAARNIAADDTVFIWAWGREARLLYELNRPCGVRHFLAHAYFRMDLRLFDEMVESFTASAPQWIVEDVRRDRPPLSADPPAEFTAAAPSLATLHEFVRSHFDRVAEFGRFVVLRRRPMPRC